MNVSVIVLLGGALAGALVGALYLGLLWVAVRYLPQDRGGVLAFVGLAVARIALVLGALALAARLGVPATGLIAALAGFVIVRLAATRLLGRAERGDGTWI